MKSNLYHGIILPCVGHNIVSGFSFHLKLKFSRIELIQRLSCEKYHLADNSCTTSI